MVVSFFDQLLPVLEVDGAILVELFSDGGDAEIGRRLAEEVRLLHQQHGRDMWFLGRDSCRLGRGDGHGGLSQG